MIPKSRSMRNPFFFFFFFLLLLLLLLYIPAAFRGNRPLSQVSSSLVVVAGEYDTMAVDVDPRYQDGRAMEQFVPVSQCFVHPGYAQINTIINLPLDDPSLANGNGQINSNSGRSYSAVSHRQGRAHSA